MHTIRLEGLTGYTEAAIYEYLQLQEESLWCIEQPKLFCAPHDTGDDLCSDYRAALYYGEVLSILSDDLCYKVPALYSPSSFEFIFHCNDLRTLAATLYYLFRGFVYDGQPEEELKHFWEEESRFWDQVCSGEIEPVCQGMMAFLEEDGDG